MQDFFWFAMDFTRKWEGGWSDHPDDKGGATNYGITIGRLKELAQSAPAWLTSIGVEALVTKDTVRSLTREQAELIYRREYWDAVSLGSFPRRVAAFLFDAHVNHGWKNAVRIAQRGYNAIIGPYGTPLSTDGVMGIKTKVALGNESDKLISACIDARENFYRSIVANNPKQKAFLKGWLNRAEDQRIYLEVS